MKIEPIRRYAQPKLPTRDVVDENPELLRLLPKRWQANPTVVAALTACLVMSNCRVSRAADTPSKVAPIFEHGKGTGAFGCIAVNPPVFLSEDEAREVVVDEAKRAGIEFTSPGGTLDKITLPTETIEQVKDAKGNAWYEPRQGTRTQSITLDGADTKRKISFEFVSEEDMNDWQTGKTTRGTAGDYDAIGTAKALRQGIAKANPGGAYGVFYDPSIGYRYASEKAGPMDYNNTDWEARSIRIRTTANNLAKEELRKQVQDFIKWLKAQGVI